MTTLALNTPRAYELGEFNEIPVIAADIIFEGAAVSDDTNGHAKPLGAGEHFLGFAVKKADNSAGAAAAINVKVRTAGLIQLAVASVAITDVGAEVFASDDNTFVLTQSTNTRIGVVHRFVSSGICIVKFDAVRSNIAELTDSSGGTASDTIAAIGATYDQAEVRNAVASLAAKVNYLLRRLGA
jgi:hypothetical protein